MACEERETLQAKYQQRVDAYVKSVLKLRDHTRAIPQVEYMVLFNAAEHIRRECEVAQRSLQRHLLEHHCS
jgi:hypothetical protein